MWRWRYVSGRQLDGFRQYKYSAVDTNPLSVYIMQPIWNKIIKIVPLWIAPNLLTFSGFVMILFNYFLISFYDWDYTASDQVRSFLELIAPECRACLVLGFPDQLLEPTESGNSPGLVPTWVWLFSAFTTFCAYALDSIDGKHARRTQSSTPLGELFDHGLDSWATSIFVLSFFSVCSRDNGKTGVSVYTMYIYLSIVLFNFMCSHWEKYNTGVLFLPWGYDISQVVLIAAYLLTSAVGVEVWQKPLLLGYYITDILVILLIEMGPKHSEFFSFDVHWIEFCSDFCSVCLEVHSSRSYERGYLHQAVCFCLSAGVGLLVTEIAFSRIESGVSSLFLAIPSLSLQQAGFSLFLSFPQTLYNIHRAHLKKTLKNDSLYEGLLPLVSPLLLFVLLTVWVVLSPSNILAKQPRLFLWMVGVTFSNVICKVIICQMSGTQPELFHWFLFPLALVVYTAISGLLGWTEEAVLAVFTALVTAAHVHYGVCVGRQLSEHLNIYIFSLKKRIQE